ncbi:hypothetical protein JCM10207_004063 [Rhodosporidiobolus poonsookiae]
MTALAVPSVGPTLSFAGSAAAPTTVREPRRPVSSISLADRDDDQALDDLLQPFSFGATPHLQLDTVGEAAEPASPAGAPHLEPSFLRPRLSHRPSSIVSRLSTSSVSSSTSGAVLVQRPWAIPPGLAANSPIPPSTSSGSTLRPPFQSRSNSGATHRTASSMPAEATQPRAARVAYEPPIPLDVFRLLLTTPPPPAKQKAALAASAAARQEFAERRAAEEATRQLERVQKERKDGLIKRLWALRSLNGTNPRASMLLKRSETPSPEEVEPEATAPAVLKAPEVLDLGARRAMGGRIDSKSTADAVPKNWKDYEMLYAAGQLDIEDPPFPPLSSPPAASSTFPSRGRPAEPASISPYDASHFPAPLHLSRITPIRERLIAQLDLLGERYAPPPPPVAALPPIPAERSLHITTAVSPVPSAGSASSATSTLGRRDSLLQFTSSPLSGRRGSGASTAPSSALSHASVAAQKLRSSGGSSVFPSRPVGIASYPHSQAMQQSLSGSSILNRSASLFTLKDYPALVNLLNRSLNAPLGSPVLFNPAPKAAVITLFPSSSSSPSSLTIVAGLNIPPHVVNLPLSHALDAHTILNGERGLVILDTERDWRWRGNELVVEGPDADRTGGGLGIRFYAGMPIFAPSLPSLAPYEESAGGRIAIGTVALLDDQPRVGKFGASERAKLRSLASEVTLEVERFLNERDQHALRLSGGSSVAPPPAAVVPASSPKPMGHAKKVSFDRGSSRRSSLAQGYVDWDAQIATASAGGSLAVPKEQDEQPPRAPSPRAPSPRSTLPPLLASTSPEVIFSAACTSLASSLSLSLVYLVLLDLSACPPAPSLVGSPTLTLIAAHNLPTDANASFDPALHLRALRAPEGGLLYRSPSSSSRNGEKAASGFASGILLPVAETESKGYVLAGYTTEARRRWGEKEMDAFEKVREGVAKVVLLREGGGWGPLVEQAGGVQEA